VLRQVSPQMDGFQLIDSLIRAYYSYMCEHQEIFSFVEQCSHCPTLSGCCKDEKGACHLFSIIQDMKSNGVIRDYSDENLAAVIFYPVKAIALDHHTDENDREERLDELIEIIQRALLN